MLATKDIYTYEKVIHVTDKLVITAPYILEHMPPIFSLMENLKECTSIKIKLVPKVNPSALFCTSLHSEKTSKFDDESEITIDCHDLMVLFLMFEDFQAEKSKFYTYIQTLPKSFTIPLCFPVQQLRLLPKVKFELKG